MMSESYNFRQLSRAILSMSKATDWETARKEWSLVNIIEAETPETCLCGHYPIIEICEISNRLTGHRTEVGNVCVKRFLGVRSDLIFTALKRIRKDADKSLNADAITFFRERSLLTDWEYGFLQDTMRKRNLSPKQLATRRRINDKVLKAVSRRGFQGQ